MSIIIVDGVQFNADILASMKQVEALEMFKGLKPETVKKAHRLAKYPKKG